MKKSLIWMLIVIFILSLTVAASACKAEAAAPAEAAAEEAAEGDMPYAGRTLKIHWAVFSPADALQTISDDVFTPLTGIEVIVEQTPWSDFTAKYNAEMIAGGDAWDIIVGDSQDVGNGAVNGHYIDLTSFVSDNGVADIFTPATLSSFGEYPAGSGKYFGIPVLTDPTHFAYRKDLLEEDEELAAQFMDIYGYDLGVPTSWDMMIDIANFFNDNVEGMYGIGVYGDNGYDSLNMFGETAIWCYGGDIGDFDTMQVEGILNSPESAAGIEAYRELFLTTPPGHGTAFFEENNNVFLTGLVPMVFNYTATFPALLNKETNSYYDDTGYFMTPPGPNGDQFTSLGGQGANVISYSANQDIAIEWLKWWILDDTQRLYATYPGSFNGSYAILDDPDFPTAGPINQIAIDSVSILKDWWNVPEYAQTIRSFADAVGKYVIGGEGTAQEALDKVAAEWTQVFTDAGYLE